MKEHMNVAQYKAQDSESNEQDVLKQIVPILSVAKKASQSELAPSTAPCRMDACG